MDSLLKNYQDIISNTSMAVNNLNTSLIVNKIKQYKTPIGIAITLVILKNIYGQIFSPPKNLKHIPHYNFFTFFKRIFQGVPYGAIEKELVVPLYQQKKKGEMYLRKGLLGWTVTITNPVSIYIYIKQNFNDLYLLF